MAIPAQQSVLQEQAAAPSIAQEGAVSVPHDATDPMAEIEHELFDPVPAAAAATTVAAAPVPPAATTTPAVASAPLLAAPAPASPAPAAASPAPTAPAAPPKAEAPQPIVKAMPRHAPNDPLAALNAMSAEELIALFT